MNQSLPNSPVLDSSTQSSDPGLGPSPVSSESAPKTNPSQSDESTNWLVEVFYDGECPLCRKEINMLRWMDRKGRIRFTDIAQPEFDAESFGLTFDEFMDEIQGRKRNGEWITGVEVFRQLYTAIGLGPLVFLTRAPGIHHALEWGYQKFAARRLKLTGRCKPDGSCSIPPQ